MVAMFQEDTVKIFHKINVDRVETSQSRWLNQSRGLHIEMTAFKSIGSLLKGSGWTSALTEARVASSGTAESFLSASSVTRTRQAHQITAVSL